MPPSEIVELLRLAGILNECGQIDPVPALLRGMVRDIGAIERRG